VSRLLQQLIAWGGDQHAIASASSLLDWREPALSSLSLIQKIFSSGPPTSESPFALFDDAYI